MRANYPALAVLFLIALALGLLIAFARADVSGLRAGPTPSAPEWNAPRVRTATPTPTATPGWWNPPPAIEDPLQGMPTPTPG